VTSAKGFRAAGIGAGFKKNGGLDCALVLSDRPCATAAVFTRNEFSAAPVALSRKHLGIYSGSPSAAGQSFGLAQAIVINAGNANAATGEPGLRTARFTAGLAASLIGCETHEVLLASTGVIGVVLGTEPFEEGLPQLLDRASTGGGHDAALAIMTTDTHPKEYALRYISADPAFAGCSFTLGGMAKGAGMIMPDMATLIVAITTDAPLSPELAHEALTQAVAVSFNKVSVDSDTSTNDSCFLMASGQAAGLPSCAAFTRESPAFAEFVRALKEVCIGLALQIARDGEGATRLVTVKVEGAQTEADADLAARAIANSPLVKTAIFGHDANWGRVAMAIGKSGARFQQKDVSIDLMGIPVCRGGLAIAFDEEEALRRFEAPDVAIEVDLGAGGASTTIFTCDFSYDYVKINGDYRT
jgi:glutamate N-acetyltransferase/amino-acid N-acetyltransferase